MIVTQKLNMNLDAHRAPSWIDAVQGDAYTRKIEMELFSGGQAWEIPEDVKVLVQFRKADGYGGAYDTLPDGSKACSINGSTVTMVLIPQMLTSTGLVRVTVSLIRGITEISTFEILINVHPNAGASITESEDYHNVGGFLPMPVDAAEGQFVRVTAVDERGIVKNVETSGVGEAMVEVPENQIFDMTAMDSTVARYSFPVGFGSIALGKCSRYRINRIAVMAAPDSTVRFALFEVCRNGDNTGALKQLAVLGDAVADHLNGVAELAFEEGYDVAHDNTIVMALSTQKVIRCYQIDTSLITTSLLRFDDADYFDAETGTEIPCSFTTEETTESSDVWFSLCAYDIDLIAEQSMTQYIKDTVKCIEGIEKKIADLLPVITILDDGKVVTVVDGAYKLAAPTAGDGTPPFTNDDNGKFLRIIDGAVAWAAVSNAEGASF